MSETFNVVIFFPNGAYHYEARNISPEEAMTLLGQVTRRPAVKLGMIERAIVTDNGDCCCAEWTREAGFTFPPELVQLAKERGEQK